MVEIMKCDPHAFKIFTSKKIVNQRYDYSGPIASFRQVSCMMHNLENTWRSFLDPVLQMQGLQHNASLSQILYDINYYVTGKFGDTWKTLAFQSVDEDIDAFKHLPISVRGKFKAICRTRWLSGERQCYKLEIHASTSLVNYIKDQTIINDEFDT